MELLDREIQGNGGVLSKSPQETIIIEETPIQEVKRVTRKKLSEETLAKSRRRKDKEKIDEEDGSADSIRPSSSDTKDRLSQTKKSKQIRT